MVFGRLCRRFVAVLSGLTRPKHPRDGVSTALFRCI